VREVFLKRSTLTSHCGRYFDAQGFMIQTPVMHPIAGGCCGASILKLNHTFLDMDLVSRIAPERLFKRGC